MIIQERNELGQLKPIPLHDLFWSKIEITSDCWLWIGQKRGKGYGFLGNGKNTISAHRLSYEIFKGKIPESMYVCHHCDNPSCVNPDHLFLGNNSMNQLDAIMKGIRKPIKLCKNDVFKIRVLLSKGETKTAIAKIFGVSRRTIYSIEKREIWNWL